MYHSWLRPSAGCLFGMRQPYDLYLAVTHNFLQSDDEDGMFDVVTEEEYQKMVQKRREESDFVVDDCM